MIRSGDWPISVCTWSLGDDLDRLGALRSQAKINHLNLSLSPAIARDKNYLKRVEKEDWKISATMINFPQEDYSTLESIKATGGIVPEQYWEANRQRIFSAIDMTAGLGVDLLLFHFGFIEETDVQSFGRFCNKVRILADAAAAKGIKLLMETGQESAAQLRSFLEDMDHPGLVVNFDPANMILYNKDNPCDAAKILAPWIRHVHIKDAIRTKVVGTWGTEVPWGTGQVGGDEFLKVLKEIGFSGALAVEREAGDNRLEDIRTAVEALLAFG